MKKVLLSVLLGASAFAGTSVHAMKQQPDMFFGASAFAGTSIYAMNQLYDNLRQFPALDDLRYMQTIERVKGIFYNGALEQKRTARELIITKIRDFTRAPTRNEQFAVLRLLNVFGLAPDTEVRVSDKDSLIGGLSRLNGDISLIGGLSRLNGDISLIGGLSRLNCVDKEKLTKIQKGEIDLKAEIEALRFKGDYRSIYAQKRLKEKSANMLKLRVILNLIRQQISEANSEDLEIFNNFDKEFNKIIQSKREDKEKGLNLIHLVMWGGLSEIVHGPAMGGLLEQAIYQIKLVYCNDVPRPLSKDEMDPIDQKFQKRVMNIIEDGENSGSQLFNDQMLSFLARAKTVSSSNDQMLSFLAQVRPLFSSNEETNILEYVPVIFSEEDSWAGGDLRINIGKGNFIKNSYFGQWKSNEVSSMYHEAGHMNDVLLSLIETVGTKTMEEIAPLFFDISDVNPEALKQNKEIMTKLRQLDLSKIKTLKKELNEIEEGELGGGYITKIQEDAPIEEVADSFANEFRDKIKYAKFRMTNDAEVYQIMGLRLIEDSDGKKILIVNKMSDFALTLEQGFPIRNDHMARMELVDRELGKLLDIWYLTSSLPVNVYGALMEVYGYSLSGYLWRLQYPSLVKLLQKEYRLNMPLRNYPIVRWTPQNIAWGTV